MYGDLLADLESARHHIHFQFFKFEDDELGRKAEEILSRKAREGVEVRLQIDDLANLTRRGFYRRMEKNGVQVEPFVRVRFLLVNSDTNYRNHRKNVVIDGRIGYTGGMNIAKRYAVGIRSGIWRDSHIRVTGPVVAEMQSAFLMDWKFSTKHLLDDPVYYPAVPRTGDLLMQVATSGPMGEFRVIMQAMLRILAESRHYVFIQTPYFIPTEAVMLALRGAALSGVDVRLMLPPHAPMSRTPWRPGSRSFSTRRDSCMPRPSWRTTRSSRSVPPTWTSAVSSRISRSMPSFMTATWPSACVRFSSPTNRTGVMWSRRSGMPARPLSVSRNLSPGSSLRFCNGR